MAAEYYLRCYAQVRKYEGGFVNDPKDPGGATLNGVTQRVYDTWRKEHGFGPRPVKAMTEGECAQIYRKYWTPVQGNTLTPGLDLATFDFSVNSGPARAKSTLATVAPGAPIAQIKGLCEARRKFLRKLSTFGHFGKGWLTRVASVEATGAKWALEAAGQGPAAVKEALTKEADKAAAATKRAVAATAAAPVSAAPLAAPTVHLPAIPHHVWPYLIAGGVVVAIVAAAVIVHHIHTHRTLADAYRKAANV